MFVTTFGLKKLILRIIRSCTFGLLFGLRANPTVVEQMIHFRLRMYFDRRSKQPWVFSRTACLGNDVYALAQIPIARHNIQKGRCDELIRRFLQQDKSRFSRKLFGCLKRTDIFPLIIEQERIWWKNPAPEFVFMDSYSELTDQLFHDKNKSVSFCANYADIKTVKADLSNINCHGLIKIEDIQDQYLRFFSMIHNLWPKAFIIFIHFPSHRETRVSFIHRAQAIREAIGQLQVDDKMIISLEMPSRASEDFQMPDDVVADEFPYHYDKQTYLIFASMLKKAVSSLPSLS
jgi:hypothetical protein